MGALHISTSFLQFYTLIPKLYMPDFRGYLVYKCDSQPAFH